MNDNFLSTTFYVLTLAAVAGLCLAQCSGGCDDVPASVRALDAAGIEHVTIGEHSVLGCGKEDTSAVEFKGKNQQGQAVEGVVCCGIWKGCTVRW